MPVRWTAEADQLILVKLLETHSIKVDYAAIAAAWPNDDRVGRPTTKAISQRIAKLRKNVAYNHDGSAPSTPVRRSCAPPPPSQRLLGDEENEDDEVPVRPKTEEPKWEFVPVKEEKVAITEPISRPEAIKIEDD
ncbi:hypothetical protein KEM55_007403 [Ascosphaera atra]|nr:hypothetical protein KEM55_007403 [Ascosphaera atra]